MATLLFLGLLDSLPKEQYWSLKGRALNILPEHSPEAEDYLARATKHDPSKVDTWNSLGESYWKAGKVQQAHDCFAGSLAHVMCVWACVHAYIVVCTCMHSRVCMCARSWNGVGRYIYLEPVIFHFHQKTVNKVELGV